MFLEQNEGVGRRIAGVTRLDGFFTKGPVEVQLVLVGLSLSWGLSLSLRRVVARLFALSGFFNRTVQYSNRTVQSSV